MTIFKEIIGCLYCENIEIDHAFSIGRLYLNFVLFCYFQGPIRNIFTLTPFFQNFLVMKIKN